MDKQKIKLIVAVAILVIALVLIVWNLGLFGGGSPPPPPPNEGETLAPRGGPQLAPGANP
jgi:hypothetical protein